jgi:phenylacetate-CoA ligase
MMALVKRAKAGYAHLPPWTRSWAASAYGYLLRHQRYGPDTERRVREALERDGWTPEEWRRYHAERLPDLLDHAATRVPFYREQWQRRRAEGDDAPWTELANWPILEKADLRRRPGAFMADGVDRAQLFEFGTSGTSGLPITTWRSRATSRAWYAIFEARTRRWYGIERGTPWAILGGQPVVPPRQTKPPFWVWNAGLRQLYLSAYHVAPGNVAAYLGALRRHRVEHLLGYPSSLYALAWMAREQGLAAPRLRAVVSNAEALHPHQRAMLAEVFGCPVHDTYGMVEIVAAGSECDHGVLHLWPDAGIVEVVDDDDDHPVPDGTAGQFLCTGLLNRDVPLIRYRIGDRGALAPPSSAPCACGRRLPAIDRLEGRTTDNVLLRDGRRVFALANIFAGLPIHERQLTQHEVDRFDIAIVPERPFDADEERLLREQIRTYLGDVRVEVRYVDAVPRGPNGKVRSTVSLLAQSARPHDARDGAPAAGHGPGAREGAG